MEFFKMNITVKNIKSVDLMNNTTDELKNFINVINEAISLKREIEKKQLYNHIQQLAEQGGFKIEELLIKPSKSVDIKYRDAENPSLTWTGRGKKPAWLQKKIDEGHNINDFLIPK
jgi:DNA-binding protein H-NS